MNKILLFFLLAVSFLCPKLTKALDFRCAEPGYQLSFPKDLGAHPDYKVEWWYYTGHFFDAQGHEYGFQWTVFRNSLNAMPTNTDINDSFTSQQVYFSHIALSDVARSKFIFSDNHSRGFNQETKMSAENLAILVNGLEAKFLGDHYNLSANTQKINFNFKLVPLKKLVIHGKDGVSKKGFAKCAASHYFTEPRLKLTGNLILQGKDVPVTGEAWMDHEFSSSQLDENAVGWDWFSIQLDNNEEIMLYFLRDKKGEILPFSSGTLITADNKTINLTANQLSLKTEATYQSQKSKITYPSAWSLQIPSLGYSFQIKTRIPDQELETSNSTGVTYYEGLIGVSGQKGSQTVTGHGYVELTGYNKDLAGKI